MTTSHRGFKAALAVFGLVIAALAVYAVLLYDSVQRLAATSTVLDEASSRLELSIANEDLPGALASIDTIRSSVNDLAVELDRWEWTVASYIPLYGGDVTIARQLLDIADSFMVNALDPVVAVLEEAFALPEGLEALTQGIPLVDEAISAVERASDEVTRASVALDMLATPRSSELADVVSQMQELIRQLETALDEIEPYLGAYESVKGLLGALGQ